MAEEYVSGGEVSTSVSEPEPIAAIPLFAREAVTQCLHGVAVEAVGEQVPDSDGLVNAR